MSNTEEPNLATLQAQHMAEKRFADMMASAGVESSRMSQELLWFLPKDFVRVYAEVFYRAFGGKEDGGTGARGRADADQVAVGKASGKGLQGLGGAKRKTYKRYWVIADDKAVDIKDRADKRLRALAREMKLGLEDDSGENRQATGRACSGCSRFMEVTWKYCPNCAQEVARGEG